ncbi:MAG: EAL domain-containing protein [Rhizobiaceae bacterium]
MARLKRKIITKSNRLAGRLSSYLQLWRLPPLERIGPEQFADLFRVTPVATLGQFVNATIVAIALWPQTGISTMLVWWAVNLVMCGWTYSRWRKNRHRKIEKLSSRAIPRAVVSGMLYALPWALLATFYLGSLPHHEELVMSIAVVGMAASGSVQLARIYPAALAYLATIFVPVIVKSITLNEQHYYMVAFLSLSYIAYLLTIVANNANASIERSTALRDLEKKVVQLDEANDSLELLASNDDLTDLPNRRTFYNHLEGSINEALLLGGEFYVLVGDLDHFKNVNDVSGHAAGDRLLQVIAERLSGCVEEGDLVARMGGDEFAIIVENQTMANDKLGFVKRLLSNINMPVDIEGTLLNPGMSFGVAKFPTDARDAESLLSFADIALQQGKAISRGQCWFFDNQLRGKLEADNATEKQLLDAIEQKQFELFYQPKVDIRTGQLHGMESLLRWRRGTDDVITPGGFFQVAEDRGLMSELADFVLERYIEDNCRWQDLGLNPGKVSVNIHPLQIKDPHRMAQFADHVEQTQLNIRNLVLEITEECVVGRGTDDVPKTLAYMRDKNFNISLDDFGTGYASLTHLKTLPVDELKIDRSFISDLNNDLSDRAIVLAMIKLADTLGISVVAEGIENQEQHNTLLAMGCATGQGYFYGRPMDVKAATEYLRKAMAAGKLQPTKDVKNETVTARRNQKLAASS